VSLSTQTKLLFLPGASGNAAFWHPVADRLEHSGDRVHYGWPGFGPTPADPTVNGMDDLVARVVADIDGPTALIAQSMGGVVAIRAALEKPSLVTHLVLSVTSGGLDVAGMGGVDWREALHAGAPALPRWFADYHEDLTGQLPKIEVPVLLLWGDADPISPVAVAERLAQLLPRAELHVIPGGDHNLANTCATQVAPLIDLHLRKSGE
jgi:pimeloyl-ACP methyl ester carboxylesterase